MSNETRRFFPRALTLITDFSTTCELLQVMFMTVFACKAAAAAAAPAAMRVALHVLARCVAPACHPSHSPTTPPPKRNPLSAHIVLAMLQG